LGIGLLWEAGGLFIRGMAERFDRASETEVRVSNTFVKGFEALDQEVMLDDLAVQGELPAWLTGVLLRNGPGQFEIGMRPFRHWFDGLAMLHRFGFANGRVSYANKFLQTPAYKTNLANGKINYFEFATDPCRAIFKRVQALFSPRRLGHNANVNIARVADTFLAMTETPLPVAFDAQTLETVGVVDYQDHIGFGTTTAHPHYDPVRQVGVNQFIRYGRKSTYNIYFLDRRLIRRIIGSVPIAEPGYMHSFGMTEHYVILVEFPLLVTPLKLLLSGKPFIENFAWKPQRGARFFVFRKQDGRLMRTGHSDAFFAFHHINAFEQDSDIFLDMAAYDDASMVQELFLNVLRGADGGAISFPEFRRYHLRAGRDLATYERLSDEPIELPRINYDQANGRAYQYAYGASYRRDKPGDFLNQLVKVDVRKRQDWIWFAEDCYPGEPVFVAAPDATAEGDGVVLSVVLNGRAGTSFLLALDATSFTELARAEVPHPIPFGFHGQYYG
jgi:carotenoid cleavage dioxygenase-like enzyme